MLKGLLKNSAFILLLVWATNTYAQILSDSLDAAIISSSQNPPKSYKKQILLLDNVNFSSSLSDVLEDKSTVYIKSYGKGQLSSVSVRGTGANQTQLYWNGFKINSPTLGQTDLSLLPTFFIDNAQLNYGNSSMVDGSGGLGGSIQLNNQLKFNKGFSWSVGQEVASFNNYTSQFELNYGTNKAQHQFKGMLLTGKNNFSYTDISQVEKPTVIQKHNETNQYGIQYAGIYQLTEKDLLKTTFYYFNSDRNLPAIIGAAESKQNQKDANLRTILTWKSFREKYTGTFKVSFFNEEMNYSDSASRIFSITKVNTLQSQYKVNFGIKNIDFDPLLQANYSSVNDDGFNGFVDRLEAAALLKVNQQIKQLGYDIMLRQSVINERLMPFTYGLGVNYELLKNKKLLAKLTASKNFRYPTLNDLYWSVGGNKNLKPEEGWSSEFGFESEIKQHKLSLYSFYGVINNWIQWQPTSNNYWTPVNLKTVENKGIEFQYSLSANKPKAKINWKLNTSYAYTSSVNKESINESDNTIGKMLIYVPKHKVSFSGELIMRVFTLKYTQQYTSKVFIDASNSIYLPYYMPAQLSLLKDFKLNKGKVNLSFSVGNLYNEQYQVVANRPQPGINYTFSVRYGVE